MTVDTFDLKKLYATWCASLAACDPDDPRHAIAELIKALEKERASHLETCHRWIKISDDQKGRIAKARKMLRTYSANAPVAAAKAYAALNWWSR